MDATHFILQSPDASALAEFYERFFGFEPIMTKERWVVFKTGSLYFAIEAGPGPNPSTSHLALSVKELDQELARLESLKIKAKHPPRIINEEDGSKVRWFVFNDPEGNQIGIYGA